MTSEFPLLFASRQFGQYVAYADSHREVSYEQLRIDAQGLARHLVQCGVCVGDRIAWVTANDYETVIRFWAVWLSGAIACPLSHRFPDSKQNEVLSQIDATLIEDVFGRSGTQASVTLPDYVPLRPATVVLSSGSTGKPKAVVHSLRAHIANAQGAAERIALRVGDRWLWALPPFHVGGLAVIVRCALGGATVFGLSDRTIALHELMDASGCTHVSLVPTQLQRWLDGGADLSGVRAILLGGTAIANSLLRRAIDLCLPIHKTYGLTEMASQVTTTKRLSSTCEHNGSPLTHREIRVVEDTNEILVRGETLCLGYLKDGELQDAADENGWFHTRDRGFINEEGGLVLLGRIDNMFISGGENIYPEAIESKLLQIDGIRQAVIVPRDDDEFGARPVAFVDAEELAANRWRETLLGSLAKFEIPIEFLSWPRDATLAIKPDRRRLQELANWRQDRTNDGRR